MRREYKQGNRKSTDKSRPFHYRERKFMCLTDEIVENDRRMRAN